MIRGSGNSLLIAHEGIHPVHFWHLQVHQSDMRMRQTRLLNRLAPVGRDQGSGRIGSGRNFWNLLARLTFSKA